MSDVGAARPRTAVVVHVERKSRAEALDRDADARLAEAVGLTAAIGLAVIGKHIVPLGRPVPATLIGSGKVDQIAAEAQVPVVERRFTPEEAAGAREAFLTAASAAAIPIVAIDGRPIGDGKPGPLTRRIAELYGGHL